METPASLVKFKAFHDAYLERIRAHRGFPPELVEIVRLQLREICGAGTLCMRVKEADLASIVADGRIKEMVELGRGTTLGGPSVRKEAAHALFDLDPEKMPKNGYPKYGYLGPDSARKDFFGLAEMAYHYGTVRFVMKRSALAERTTVLVGNGINFGNCYFRVPCMLGDPDITCLGELVHHPEAFAATGLTRRERPEPAQCAMAFAVACAKGKLTKANFWQIEDTFEGTPGFEFFELHFHGDLVLSRDVERVEVWDWTDSSQAVFEAAKPAFERLGVPISFITSGI